MRVNIGPYRNWFGPYQLAELLMFWVPKERDEHGFLNIADRVHRFGEWLAHGSVEPEPNVGDITKWRDRPITWLYRFLLWIDRVKPQRRIQVRIDPWDTWSMDHTLAHIIVPMLRQLKSKTHGSPYVDDADVPEDLRSTAAPPKKDEHDIDDNHHRRWAWALDEMIFAFESKLDESWEKQFESGEIDLQWRKLDNGMSEMLHGPKHTRVYDEAGRQAYQDRINNGFRLFGRYYNSLWD